MLSDEQPVTHSDTFVMTTGGGNPVSEGATLLKVYDNHCTFFMLGEKRLEAHSDTIVMNTDVGICPFKGAPDLLFSCKSSS